MSKLLVPVVVTYTTHIDPEEMSRRGRIGAHVTHSRHDARELTAPAREAFLSKFEQEVDPSGELSLEERQRRASHARRGYFAKLARMSALARRKLEPSRPKVTKEVEHASA
jgi:hypothetical protein